MTISFSLASFCKSENSSYTCCAPAIFLPMGAPFLTRFFLYLICISLRYAGLAGFFFLPEVFFRDAFVVFAITDPHWFRSQIVELLKTLLQIPINVQKRDEVEGNRQSAWALQHLTECP